ncbi:chalcone isomerase family protein [Hydrogenophaga sp.]|uniref:chalcone isomerase family protein n=1 Tax=Hydrogenophaga sp. TaxID=1904254 RepID=UPI002718FD63|nr:chalcone isomerase family protein [Hydrogenophaga sp.]MDO8903143.1 chalcone isomerase family protein [Hydrogenophaga sp.]
MNTFRTHPLPIVLFAFVAAWMPATVLASAPEPTASAALEGKRATDKVRLRVWGFEVYDASLYTVTGFNAEQFADHRFGLELSYLRSFKGNDIAQRSIDEMRGVTELTSVQAEGWLKTMIGIFPDVQRGDRITGVHVPGSGARFYLNDRLLGDIADEAFSRSFFGIWLSPKTSQPRMRETLIGQSGGASRAP